MRRRWALLGGLAFATGARAQPKTDLRTQARRAALYLRPLYEMYARRFTDTIELGHKLNALARRPEPREGMLEASAWLDLGDEPMFLTLPDMGERFYSAAFLDPFTDNFAHVSSRLSGAAPKPRMIVGPAWTGDASREVERVRAPSKSVWLRIHIAFAADDDDDLAEAYRLLSALMLETPDQRNERRILETRELMRYRTYAPPEPRSDWPAPKREDRFDLFEAGLAMLGECALGERDRNLLADLADLHLHPGHRFDIRAFSEGERAAIAQGIADAAAELHDKGPALGKTVGGWRYPQANLGAYGNDDLYRAYIATTSLGAPIPAEMLDLVRERDGARVRLYAPGPELLDLLK
ncbi:MAG TPA: DUF1254 domain-containing protein [Reyranella sp.]|nr:DUF1254 domain-containing protein [Reyranella sp.]